MEYLLLGKFQQKSLYLNPKESPYHILDMSWTALLMLRWYDELEKDARLLAYAEDYAMALLGIQYENGFSLAGLT